MRQALSDRMVLLMVGSSGTKCVLEANIQSVMRVMDKRYRLKMDTSPAGISSVLDGLTEQDLLLVDPDRREVSMGKSGTAYMEQLFQLQPSFCSKFVREVGAICPALNIAG
jgi:hypothetical protein